MKRYWTKIRFLFSLFLLALVVLSCSVAAPSEEINLELDHNVCITQEYLESAIDDAYARGQAAGCEADVVLDNPTHAELCQFLNDNQVLTRCEGNCVDRVVNLNEAAIKAGWAMGIVLMNAEEKWSGHVIGAFNTKDKGVIYIEPQTLWEVKVEIGYDYSKNYEEHGWYFPPFTIKQIGVLW